MAKQLAFYFDSTACTGCKACQLACKDKNDLPVANNYRHVVLYGGGGWTPQGKFMFANHVFTYALSVSCNHCTKPICQEVCPVSAITKRDDGVVLIDQARCIGCRYCEWSCPYGAPQFDEAKGVMTKCDFCVDLLANGEKPACVDGCVMRCLDYGDLEELRQKYGNIQAVEPLPDEKLTGPAWILTPHKHSQKVGHGTGRILGIDKEK